jgi:hypothetical protein
MTFVSQAQAAECALGVITRIKEKFKPQEVFFLQTQVGVVYTDFKLENCKEASVSLIPHPTQICATVVVSRSVGAFMQGKDHPFEVRNMADGGCLFSVYIRNQTSSKRHFYARLPQKKIRLGNVWR